MAVHHWSQALDGPFSEEALRARLEGLGYRVARQTYPPGTVLPDHRREVDKIDAVISGRLRLVVGGHLAMLGPGDSVAVPRGTVHNATVVGSEAVIALEAIKLR
jgi:mannose-6-phosphate isomerase-like protein (cupin superfamily)